MGKLASLIACFDYGLSVFGLGRKVIGEGVLLNLFRRSLNRRRRLSERIMQSVTRILFECGFFGKENGALRDIHLKK
jgi:hypothetical protein